MHFNLLILSVIFARGWPWYCDFTFITSRYIYFCSACPTSASL
ncbi:hypothetical protein PROSTU_02149 [Providencia stuartii ATCC 25827]|uniref:Uncharacterized protein n=1 Tax=Providencia stuartii ATCC 25827 TaxID=471874 RepID=A0AA87CSS4_PROST|nr:hypothetical protein PROSTU_02149 [Providencia stuartii ATCC 25827]